MEKVVDSSGREKNANSSRGSIQSLITEHACSQDCFEVKDEVHSEYNTKIGQQTTS